MHWPPLFAYRLFYVQFKDLCHLFLSSQQLKMGRVEAPGRLSMGELLPTHARNTKQTEEV